MKKKNFHMRNIAHTGALRTDRPEAHHFPICMYEGMSFHIIRHITNHLHNIFMKDSIGWLPLPTPSIEALTWKKCKHDYRFTLPSGVQFRVKQVAAYFKLTIHLGRDRYSFGKFPTFQRAHGTAEKWLQNNRYAILSDTCPFIRNM